MKLAFVDIGKQFQVKPGVGIEKLGTLGDIISAILPNIYILAGIILFILLIIGGFGIIMGAGEENPEKAKKGKQAMTAALVGFLLIFASWWIIKIIEVMTGLEIFKSGF